MKKKLIKGLGLLLAIASFTSLVSCSKNDKEDVIPEIKEVYNTYLANGGTLSYDEWLAQIKGEKGDKGDKGETGSNGMSAYELYKKYHPEYTKTEKEWVEEFYGSSNQSSNNQSQSSLKYGVYESEDNDFIIINDEYMYYTRGNSEFTLNNEDVNRIVSLSYNDNDEAYYALQSEDEYIIVSIYKIDYIKVDNYRLKMIDGAICDSSVVLYGDKYLTAGNDFYEYKSEISATTPTRTQYLTEEEWESAFDFNKLQLM